MTPDEQLSFALMDAVSQVPSFKRLARTVDFFVNGGYLHLAPGLDYGSTFFSYAYNTIEQNRFWAGLRTNTGFNKKWASSGYLAYGTQNLKFKYGLDMTFIPKMAPMTRSVLKTNLDLDQIGIRQADIGDNPLFQLASRFGKLHETYYQRDYQAFFQRESKYIVGGNSDIDLSQVYLPKSVGPVPYVEVGYGVDNIFRFLRVVAVHRLTHLNAPGGRSFSVRASIHIAL